MDCIAASAAFGYLCQRIRSNASDTGSSQRKLKLLPRQCRRQQRWRSSRTSPTGFMFHPGSGAFPSFCRNRRSRNPIPGFCLLSDGPLADALADGLSRARTSCSRARRDRVPAHFAGTVRNRSGEPGRLQPPYAGSAGGGVAGLIGSFMRGWRIQTANRISTSVLDRGVFSAMFLVQAMEESSSTRQVEFNVVSDRAYSISGEPVSSPAPAALNAFCGVIALECPNISARVIDIDLASNPAAVTRQLLEGTRVSCVERNGRVSRIGPMDPAVRAGPAGGACRIRKPQQDNGSRIAIRTGGTYLITGGLGGVGLVFAQHLARRANAQIVLTSRTPLPPASEWEALLDSPDTPDAHETKTSRRQVHRGGGREGPCCLRRTRPILPPCGRPSR